MSYHEFYCEEMERLRELEQEQSNNKDKDVETDYTATTSSSSELCWNNRDSKVQFDLESINIISIHARCDYTEEESNLIWYQASDLSDISSWNRMTLKLFSQLHGDLTHEPDHCIRGLENKIKEDANERRKDLRISAKYAVFDEQGRQRNKLYRIQDDPVQIRLAYQQFTVPCQLEAQQRGAEDERASKEVEASKQKSPANKRNTITGFDDNDLTALKEFGYENQQKLDRSTSCQKILTERNERLGRDQQGGGIAEEKKKTTSTKGLKMTSLMNFVKIKKKKSSPKTSTRKSAKNTTASDEPVVAAGAVDYGYGYAMPPQQEQEGGHDQSRRRMRRRSSM